MGKDGAATAMQVVLFFTIGLAILLALPFAGGWDDGGLPPAAPPPPRLEPEVDDAIRSRQQVPADGE